MKAAYELLSTKDANNVLQFHKQSYFMDEKGILKAKYYKAINELKKENLVELTATYNDNQKQWNWYWSFIG